MLQKPELSAGLMGHLARKQTLPYLPVVVVHYLMKQLPRLPFHELVCFDYQSFNVIVSIVCQQEDKIYVQHRLLENRALVWDILAHKQGWCYIAGYDEL